MIPHRMLSSEICGNGLKVRVTAWRKRLCVNRVAQRAQLKNDAEELSPETTPVSRFDDYAAPLECATMPASVVRMNCGSPFAGAGLGKSETLLLVGEPEVGIT